VCQYTRDQLIIRDHGMASMFESSGRNAYCGRGACGQANCNCNFAALTPRFLLLKRAGPSSAALLKTQPRHRDHTDDHVGGENLLPSLVVNKTAFVAPDTRSQYSGRARPATVDRKACPPSGTVAYRPLRSAGGIRHRRALPFTSPAKMTKGDVPLEKGVRVGRRKSSVSARSGINCVQDERGLVLLTPFAIGFPKPASRTRAARLNINVRGPRKSRPKGDENAWGVDRDLRADARPRVIRSHIARATRLNVPNVGEVESWGQGPVSLRRDRIGTQH